MFETDPDVDFGDDFTFNLTRKRPLEPSVSKKPRNVVKRKFPGPAGLLPEGGVSESSEEIPCSQMTVSVFQNEPWLEVCKDFGGLLDQYDIKWVKSQADTNKLPDQKVPFLAAIIKQIECLEGKYVIVKVVLKDVSGEIEGTIVQNLYEKYQESLVTGAVVVLRQCGVLTTNSSNNHYLTITERNLAKIYWKSNEELRRIELQELEANKLSSQANCSSFEEAFEGVDMSLFFEDF